MSGIYFLWDGWLCKIHELIGQTYRIVCPGWDTAYWKTVDDVMRLLGRP